MPNESKPLCPNWPAKSTASAPARSRRLPRLLELAEKPLTAGGIGVFLKGEEWRDELTAVEATGSFTCESAESRTRKGARIVVIKRKASPS